MKRFAILCIATASAAFAQGTEVPLDLRVPEQAAVPQATETTATGDPPGVYHGDTSGKPASGGSAEIEATDDGKAKVWGSFTTGIGHTKGYGTSHYNAAEVNVGKSFGDGERKNAVHLQIRVEKSEGPGFGDRYRYPYFNRDSDYPPPR